MAADSKMKKVAKYNDDESDLDEDWIVTYEDDKRAKDIEKAQKKFAKDNENRAADNDEPIDDSVLEQKIEVIEEAYKSLVKERGKRTAASNKSEEKLKDGIDKLEERIKTAKLQTEDREAGKEVALGTRFALAIACD